jgi:cysteine synthase B
MNVESITQESAAAAKSIRSSTIDGLIGNTPLIRVQRVIPDSISDRVQIYIKAEWFNPGGSVKDRPALNIVNSALAKGHLSEGRVLMDSTSGNTGIAYAMIGAAKGIPVELVMPSNVSEERKKIITAYGVKITYSDPLEGSDGARELAKNLLKETPEKYFYADQYANDANWKAHYETTGPEIWRDTNGQITHFVAGLGTSGTIMGTSRYLKEQNPEVQCVALQPEPFHGIEGWKNMDTAIPVPIYEPRILDRVITLPTDPAYHWAKTLGIKEGLLVSPSAGAAFHGALELAKELKEGLIVVVFADSADRYLSTHLHSN